MNIIDFEIKLAQVCSVCTVHFMLFLHWFRCLDTQNLQRFGRIFHHVQVMPSGRKAHDDENLYRKLTVKELNEYAGNDQVCCVTLNNVIAP